jgi:hypothetical protein
MIPTPQDVLNALGNQIKGAIVADVYARVEHINMLAHYTSIQAFRSIVASQQLWFSLVRDTNDTSEVIEGTRIVSASLQEHGPRMFADYESFDTARQFEARRELLETDTYVLSLCEHGSDSRTDRLEMWKDYGHNGNGLCMVLRKATVLDQSAKGRFPVHWAPIEYAKHEGLSERVRRRLLLIKRVINATQHVETLSSQVFGMLIAQCVVQLVLSHKNIGFEYEKEVRFVRSRLLQELAPPEGAGYRNVTIDGVVKSKFILPLRYYPEFKIDASLIALLDQIIIGPSSHQDYLHRELVTILSGNHLDHVPIIRSDIPYRPAH